MKTIAILFGGDPRKYFGGVEKVSKEISKELDNTYELTYMFMDTRNHSEKIGNIVYNGIKSFGIFPLNILYFAYQLKKYNFDLIIDNMGITNLYNNIYSKTKILQICHGVAGGAIRNLDVGNIFSKIGYFFYYFFIHIIWKITYKRADLIIIAPKGGKKLIHKYYGVNNEKIKIIYNGVDFISRKIIPYDGTLKIIFISNNHPRRGIHRLEKVAEKLENKNIVFKIVGANYKTKTSNVKYLGKLVGEHKYKEITNSDVVFMPSCYEGQNLTVLEGMSMGCIPLVSKNTNTNIIEGTELDKFISDDNDIQFYVDKINYLLENPNKIDILKKLSQNLVKDYTWDNQAKEYLETINELLY